MSWIDTSWTEFSWTEFIGGPMDGLRIHAQDALAPEMPASFVAFQTLSPKRPKQHWFWSWIGRRPTISEDVRARFAIYRLRRKKDRLVFLYLGSSITTTAELSEQAIDVLSSTIWA